MEYPETGGEFDAHRLMQLHLQLQPKPLTRAYQLAMGANVVLSVAVFVLMVAGQESHLRPSAWMIVAEAGAPWVAVAAALRFPKRCAVLADQDGVRIPLFGIWLFVALAPFTAFRDATLVRLLPALGLGSAAGAVLFAAAAMARRRTKEGAVPWAILLLLSLSYGCANVVQANCGLDDSPATVFRTVVSGKHTSRGGRPYLDLEPWGGNPAPTGPMSRYSPSVPRATYDAVRVGGPVCVEQSEGALGMAWYTARPCL